MRSFFTLLVFLFSGVFLVAQEAKWDVNEPFGTTKNVTFTTTEGTWMNLDVSPDGKEIVFDLLGDIYIMPISGGKAKRLLGGAAYEVQPRFSPDGKHISFTSDRDGADNIWVMDRNGSNLKQITKETFRLLNNASWSPDGEYLVARKHFTATRSLGAGEMWLYHVSGGYSGLQLTKRKNDQQDAGEPIYSPDGKYIYYSEDMSGGSTFEYNKDPNGQIYVIRRLNLETGELSNYITGAGGAVRPQPSPDGKQLAFVRRVRTKSVLFIYDVASGATRPIYDDLFKDQQETWAIFGVYPNFNWTPDGKHIVIWGKGKIYQIDVENRTASEIPFEVDVAQTIHEALRFKHEVSPKTFESKMIRNAVTSPDGNWLVFNAVGHLWKKKLPNGKPERLTQDAHFEFFPSFSPDGKWVTYATWNDDALGAIYKVALNGGSTTKLTTRKGYYTSPKYAPDGEKIVYERGGGNAQLGFVYGTETGIYWISSKGGEEHFIQSNGNEPTFNKAGNRIYFMTGGGLNKSYKSARLDGGDERTHFTMKYPNSVAISPDENWVAFTELYNVYITPFPKTGTAIELNKDSKAIPLKQVSRDAGNYLHWSGDSQKLHWTIGNEYFTQELKDAFSFVANAPETLPEPSTVGIPIGLTLETDIPTGKVALVGARIITMNGDEVIENGTLVIKQNRIETIGNQSQITVPADAKVIDVSGKTIMPGLVDVHAHVGNSSNGISPQQSWSYFANLAFGVTTAHDPSSNTEMIFSQSEMIKAGQMVGPRLYSTGTILYGADGDFKAVVNSIEDARSHLRRMKAVGAISVKSYNQPRRNQRQQILKAASELEMMVVPEGGSFFFHNISMVIDGHTGIEHSIPVAPLYKDVINLWKETNVGYTPTLVVGYGGIWGENYWYQKTNVWENEHLLTFTPRAIVDSRSRRRMMAPDDDFGHIQNAESAKALYDAGGHVQLGAHGQLQGLGAHWEMWMFAQGGMKPLEAIRASTLYGAWYIGLDDEIGSLEKGKLADLIVLDKNPLDDIQNSQFVNMVMVNGRLYDAKTMNQMGNHSHTRGAFFWEKDELNDAFIWRDGLGFQEFECGCFSAH